MRKGPTGSGWTCPRCARQFARRGQSHSCGSSTVKAHLEAATPEAKALYREVAAFVKSLGPVAVGASKNAIRFSARTNFLAVFLRRDGLQVAFSAPRRLGAGFAKIVTHSPRLHEHYLAVRAAGDLDARARTWIREAYQRDVAGG